MCTKFPQEQCFFWPWHYTNDFEIQYVTSNCTKLQDLWYNCLQAWIDKYSVALLYPCVMSLRWNKWLIQCSLQVNSTFLLIPHHLVNTSSMSIENKEIVMTYPTLATIVILMSWIRLLGLNQLVTTADCYFPLVTPPHPLHFPVRCQISLLGFLLYIPVRSWIRMYYWLPQTFHSLYISLWGPKSICYNISPTPPSAAFVFQCKVLIQSLR